MGGAECFSAALSLIVANKLGRRPMLVVGQFLVAFCLLAISISIKMRNGKLCTVILCIYELFHWTTLAPLVNIYPSEISNDSQLGFMYTLHYLGNLSIAVLTEYLIKFIGSDNVFLGISIITFIGFIAYYFLLKETKGLTFK